MVVKNAHHIMQAEELCFCKLKCHVFFNFWVQVNNTDAEGRLTLADALVYACNQGVDKVLRL